MSFWFQCWLLVYVKDRLFWRLCITLILVHIKMSLWCHYSSLYDSFSFSFKYAKLNLWISSSDRFNSRIFLSISLYVNLQMMRVKSMFFTSLFLQFFQGAFVTRRLNGDKLIFSKCEKRIANFKFIVDINVCTMRKITYRIYSIKMHSEVLMYSIDGTQIMMHFMTKTVS